MAILDSQGRLFGKVNILDLGAALIMLLVVIGIFIFPGTTGSAQIGTKTQAIEVDIIAKGVGTSDPKQFIADLQASKQTNLIIRNQPYGKADIKSVQVLPRSVSVPQPDGSVKSLNDPRPELAYSTDMLVTLSGKAQIKDGEAVLGGNKVKIGTQVEIEGSKYNFNCTVVDVRLKE
mgnify:CR=1 FL=1